MGAFEFIPSIPGDFDGDGDVDSEDLAVFEACFTGPAIAGLPPGCSADDFAAADADGDQDIDQVDFGILQRCYSGEDNPADPSYAN